RDARRRTAARRRRLDRARPRDRRDHLGGARLAAGARRLPRRGRRGRNCDCDRARAPLAQGAAHMSLANLLARIPRPLLFVLAGLIQVGLIAVMVVDRMQILRDGTEVTLQTRPVDPRDFLRGDYVVLTYDISSVAAGALQGTAAASKDVYIKLAPKADG